MSNQEPNKEPLPLEQRVCLELLTAGHLAADGTLPKCMGRICTSFEACEAAIKLSIVKLEDLKKGKRLKERKPKPSVRPAMEGDASRSSHR